MLRSSLFGALVAIGSCYLSTALQAADWTVAAGGGGDFTAIQPAVAAAAPNDLILVQAGSYAGNVMLDGKPLWIVADAPRGTVVVNGTLTVTNLASDEIAVLIGLDVRGATLEFGDALPALHLASNAGEVRAQASTFSGGDAFHDGDSFGTKPGPGARIEGSARVTLSTSVFRGGAGAAVSGSSSGGDGVKETTSAVAAWGCEFRGGDGGSNSGIGPFGEPTNGGAGFRATTFGVFAAGCLFQGGDGGDESDLCIYQGADGGPGLFLPAMGTQARVMSSTFAGGTGGNSCTILGDPPGDPGDPVAGGGTPIQVSGAARWLEGPALVSAGQPHPFTVHGASGDLVYLRQDDVQRYLFKPWRKGFDLVDARWMPIEPFAVPGSGTLVTTRTDHAWVAGDRTRLFGQAYVVTASGPIVLGGPLALVVGP